MQAKVTVAMLIEIKANEEIASFNIAHYHIWKDPRLVWDPLDYDNISNIYVPYSLVWRPKLYIYNGIDIKDLLHDDVQIVQIQNNGLVTSFTQQYVLSICKLNLKRFPFDSQFCAIGQTTAILPVEIIDVEVLPPPTGHDALFLGNEEFEMTNVYTRKRYFHEENKTRFAKVCLKVTQYLYSLSTYLYRYSYV
uniref:Neurotransmitter-gated ion-channel ligand-binding domain-containing protein n=1 Tax=Acrobeloides nanus TaxID=290746 RepID=A0A914CQ22_9BILA